MKKDLKPDKQPAQKQPTKGKSSVTSAVSSETSKVKSSSRSFIPLPNDNGTDSNEKNSNGDSKTGEYPSLDGFLLTALRNYKDCSFILKLEEDIEKFLNSNDQSRIDLPPMNSYHRLIVHRVAQYFNLAHVVDSTKNAIILFKTKESAMPDLKLSDLAEYRDVNDEYSSFSSGVGFRGRGRSRGGSRGNSFNRSFGYHNPYIPMYPPQYRITTGSGEFFVDPQAGVRRPMFATPNFPSQLSAETAGTVEPHMIQAAFPGSFGMDPTMFQQMQVYFAHMISMGYAPPFHPSMNFMQPMISNESGAPIIPYPYINPDQQTMEIPISYPISAYNPQTNMDNLGISVSSLSSDMQQLEIENSDSGGHSESFANQRKFYSSEAKEPSHILELFDINTDTVDVSTIEIPEAHIKRLGNGVVLAIFKNTQKAEETCKNHENEYFKLRLWKAQVNNDMSIPPVHRSSSRFSQSDSSGARAHTTKVKQPEISSVIVDF